MSLEVEIKNRLVKIQPQCPLRATRYGIFPTKGGDGGDDCLWLGLLTSVGVHSASLGLFCSQAGYGEKRPGMFYRNPERRETDNAGHAAYFSRDMALGVLAGYTWMDHGLATQSKERWLQWIYANRACSVKKPKWMGGGCLVRAPFYRYAPDDRSDITPTMWALMGRIWESRAWSKTGEMKTYEGSDGDVSIFSAENNPLGYQLHLVVVQQWIKTAIDQSKEYRQKIARIAYERQPENLFYKIIANGLVTNNDMQKFLDVCPKELNPQDSWLWEKSEINFEKYCGWDYVFLGKLILKMKGL